MDFSTAATLCSGATKVRDRFCVKPIRSLTSPNAKRISGPRKFRSSAKKDFFNTIRHERSFHNFSFREETLHLSRGFECYHPAWGIGEDRRLAQEMVGRRSGGATRTPDRSNFRSLSQAALTLRQSQLMERTMLCPRITQQSLRKPLDAGCFEGDSTRAGPKPPVQLYDRDHLRSHLQKFRQETM